MVHLWLLGKHVVDFLLMLIKFFRQLSVSRLRRYEQIMVEIVVLKRRSESLGYNVELVARSCI